VCARGGSKPHTPSPTPVMAMSGCAGGPYEGVAVRDKRKELLAWLIGIHALVYWVSAQRVRAFTGGRSASRGRLTR